MTTLSITPFGYPAFSIDPNLSDKKLQTYEKKTQNCKFRPQKVTQTSVRKTQK